MNSVVKCEVCGNDSILFDSATIMNKYNVKYYKCNCCGFVQTEKPYWLDESYGSAITSSDIGLIRRNVEFAKKTDLIFKIAFKNARSFLDYGGGYGIFVRLMRDRGYDFEWYDKYCENLFAISHERSKTHYDVITSYEMLEHLPSPYESLESLFEMAESLIFSTYLLRDPCPKVNDWWYYATEHGQHISFYSKSSLCYIAQKFGKRYYNISNIHIFSNELSIFQYWFIFLCFKFPVIGNIANFLFKRHSAVINDYISAKI